MYICLYIKTTHPNKTRSFLEFLWLYFYISGVEPAYNRAKGQCKKNWWIAILQLTILVLSKYIKGLITSSGAILNKWKWIPTTGFSKCILPVYSYSIITNKNYNFLLWQISIQMIKIIVSYRVILTNEYFIQIL